MARETYDPNRRHQKIFVPMRRLHGQACKNGSNSFINERLARCENGRAE
jgi:hypothetical protein